MSLFFILWISTSSFLSLLMSMAAGHLNFVIAALSLFISGAFSFLIAKPKIVFPELGQRHLYFLLFFGLFSLQFTYLLYEIRIDEVWIATINPNNRGDLPFHINMIKAFARGLSIWPDHLFLIGERLRYPFAMNLFNAQFYILGIPLQTHLMAVGLLCLGLLMFELYAWMGVWGLICFFLSGGVGSYLPGGELAFKNLYLSVFVTQRGFLWALPAGIWLIRNFANVSGSKTRTGVWIFLLGVMPFFHLHSFAFLFLYFSGLHLIRHGFKMPKRLIVAGLMATPWVLQAIWKNDAGQILHLSNYWFSFKNFGAWGAVAVVSLLLAVKKKEFSKEYFWVLSLSLVFSIVMLAPWDWDQIKILIWCYLLLNAIILENLIKKMPKHYATLVATLVFYPGVLQVWNSLPENQFRKDPVYLAKLADVKMIQSKLAQVHPDDVVLIAPVYNHPIFFAGQSVVVGYPGHIWSQASKIKPALDFLEQVVDSGKVPDPQPFSSELKWILNSPFEKEKWPTSPLFSKEDWSLFCVRPGHCQ